MRLRTIIKRKNARIKKQLHGKYIRFSVFVLYVMYLNLLTEWEGKSGCTDQVQRVTCILAENQHFHLWLDMDEYYWSIISIFSTSCC